MHFAFSLQVGEFFIKHININKIKIHFGCGSDFGCVVITRLAMVLFMNLRATRNNTYTPFYMSMVLEYAFDPIMHHAEHGMLYWITVIETVKCRPPYSILIENLVALHFGLCLLPFYSSLTNIDPNLCMPVRWIKAVHLTMKKIAK